MIKEVVFSGNKWPHENQSHAQTKMDLDKFIRMNDLKRTDIISITKTVDKAFGVTYTLFYWAE